MSDYLRKTKNPETGKFEMASWMDDYFGKHQYGIKFLGRTEVYREDAVEWEFDDTPEEEKKQEPAVTYEETENPFIDLNILADFLFSEGLLKPEYGVAMAMTRNNGKGCGCCYCGECGYHNDDCICEHNRWIEFLIKHTKIDKNIKV